MPFAWSPRLLLAHFFVTAALAGLIWTIQVVHYPLFDRVERSQFAAFQHSHSSRISIVVGPLMIAEFLLAGYLLFRRPPGISLALASAAFGLLVIVHIGTVFFSVPAHDILGNGFDAHAHSRLVNTNWIRTVGWTLRALTAGYLVSAFVAENSRAL